jgi:hypothetical protein
MHENPTRNIDDVSGAHLAVGDLALLQGLDFLAFAGELEEFAVVVETRGVEGFAVSPDGLFAFFLLVL